MIVYGLEFNLKIKLFYLSVASGIQVMKSLSRKAPNTELTNGSEKNL